MDWSRPIAALGDNQLSLPGSFHRVRCIAWLAKCDWTSTPVHFSAVQGTGGTVVLSSPEFRP